MLCQWSEFFGIKTEGNNGKGLSFASKVSNTIPSKVILMKKDIHQKAGGKSHSAQCNISWSINNGRTENVAKFRKVSESIHSSCYII